MAAGLPVCKGEGQGRAMPGDKARPARHRTLHLCNRHPDRPVGLGLLRRIARALLEETWRDSGFDLTICLVAAPEMTRLNEGFLRHKGSTDVITFDYVERDGQGSRRPSPLATSAHVPDSQDACPALLHGEIVVCLDEAVRQARLFHTTWQSELVRYVVHGLLHLLDYDDRTPQARRRMKAAEDALVRRLASQFSFRALCGPRAGSNS